MKRWVPAGLFALIGLLVAMTAAAGLGMSGGATQPGLYGVTWQGSLGLVRVDPDTLRPRSGRRVPIAGEPLAWSFAPDRSRLVLGSAARGTELRLIDLRAMELLGNVKVTRRGSTVATAWAGPRRVLAVVVTPGCCGAGDTIVAGIDAVRRHVVWRQRLGGSLQAGERFGGRLFLVLGPRGRSLGPSRLVRVGPQGRVRSVELPEIRSGSEPAGSVTETWSPGLAVDPAGARAFVVQAQAPVTEVDLRTFQVRPHSLGPWAKAADDVVGPQRDALWLGRGLLAVTGSDSEKAPAGLTLVDTRRWRARTIDARATDAALVSGTLFASSLLYDARSQRVRGSGLTGFSIDGRRRFHLYGRQAVTGVQPVGSKALVGTRSGIALIDARTGQQLRRFRRFAMSLIGGDAPILD